MSAAPGPGGVPLRQRIEVRQLMGGIRRAEVTGLLALMLLNDARRPPRTPKGCQAQQANR